MYLFFFYYCITNSVIEKLVNSFVVTSAYEWIWKFRTRHSKRVISKFSRTASFQNNSVLALIIDVVGLISLIHKLVLIEFNSHKRTHDDRIRLYYDFLLFRENIKSLWPTCDSNTDEENSVYVCAFASTGYAIELCFTFTFESLCIFSVLLNENFDLLSIFSSYFLQCQCHWCEKMYHVKNHHAIFFARFPRLRIYNGC